MYELFQSEKTEKRMVLTNLNSRKRKPLTGNSISSLKLETAKSLDNHNNTKPLQGVIMASPL